ncbi:hypothetical protein [Thermomonas alba]|uniref:hypothetical protein n=1 Tax=Thermomonas alba TaxID=2888525 RepID=UPI001F038FA7|nr:hypothetical protein [Thermomonas alba]
MNNDNDRVLLRVWVIILFISIPFSWVALEMPRLSISSICPASQENTNGAFIYFSSMIVIVLPVMLFINYKKHNQYMKSRIESGLSVKFSVVAFILIIGVVMAVLPYLLVCRDAGGGYGRAMLVSRMLKSGWFGLSIGGSFIGLIVYFSFVVIFIFSARADSQLLP